MTTVAGLAGCSTGGDGTAESSTSGGSDPAPGPTDGDEPRSTPETADGATGTTAGDGGDRTSGETDPTTAAATETGDDADGAATTTGADDGTATPSPVGTPETPSEDLDLREANVTAVEFESLGDGEYRFSVTLIHDDDGEDGYANWWQVEHTDGERLGRRTLLHAHGTREFTRSERIAIPPSVEVVVVRGHDQTHGYGGQAAVVDLASGDVRFVRQGPDRQPIGE